MWCPGSSIRRRAVPTLFGFHNSQGGTKHACRQATDLLRRADALVQRGLPNLRLTSEAQAVAVELGMIGGWLYFDAGKHTDAKGSWQYALRGYPADRTNLVAMDGRWPRAGKQYPRSTGEFQSWFATDADCLDYLEWLRWPDGFVCPRCAHAGGWALVDARYKCAACGARTAVTAGTLFDRRRTPLTVWFTACWMFAAHKTASRR